MYDGRCTMYDLGSSRALRGIWQSKCGRDVLELCAGAVRKRRGRLAAPMYDVRRTMYDLFIMRTIAVMILIRKNEPYQPIRTLFLC